MAVADRDMFEGSVKPSSIEADGYEKDLYAHRHVEIPSNMQARWVYDADGVCTYAGYAPKGLAEASNGWLLYKFTIVSKLQTSRLIAYGNWTNYSGADYS